MLRENCLLFDFVGDVDINLDIQDLHYNKLFITAAGLPLFLITC